MRLTYRNSEMHAAVPPASGIASVAHVFTDAHSAYVFGFCEMADGSTFWCNKPEDNGLAPLALMFWMQPPAPWLEAVAAVPPELRMSALIARMQKGGAT